MTATTGPDRAAFLAELRAFEGRQVGPAQEGPDEVNRPMIRHWCEAIGDGLSVYTDPEVAAASVHGGIVAPPTMLQAWVMRGLKPRPATGGTEQDQLMAILDSAGFSSVVATNCEQEYDRYLVPGDRLFLTTTIESVSDEKTTALGVGHFVTTASVYTDQDGERVATHRFRILKFRPASRPGTDGPEGKRDGKRAGEPDGNKEERPAASAGAGDAPESQSRPKRPRPALTRDNAFFFEGAREGKLLIQRCASCGRLRHPPGPMCPACHSLEWEPEEASGRGTVYSFVVNHYPQVPAFDYPLVVALIELEEGTRLVSNLVGVDPSDVRVGMAVRAETVAFDEELTLPQFRPVATEGAR